MARCAEEALALFDPAVHDVVVTADIMPGITGAELAHIIKLRSPRTPVVLVADGRAPADRPCLDAVLEKGAEMWGLAGVLQRLAAPPVLIGRGARHAEKADASASLRCNSG